MLRLEGCGKWEVIRVTNEFESKVSQVLIETIQLLQVGLGELKVQNLKVLLDAFSVDTLGNSGSAAFDQITIENLGRGLIMAFRDFLQLGLFQKNGIIGFDGHASWRAERAVRSERNAVFLAELEQGLLHKVGMALNLEVSGLDTSAVQNMLNLGVVKVGQTNRFHQTLVDGLFKLLPNESMVGALVEDLVIGAFGEERLVIDVFKSSRIMDQVHTSTK